MSVAVRAFVRKEFVRSAPPPAASVGRIARTFHGLFGTPFNIMMTFVSLATIALVVPPLLRFLVFDATWEGTSREDCLPNAGACWPFVHAKFGQFVYGFYPWDLRWRPNVVFALGALLLAPLLIPSAPLKRLNALLFFGAYPLVAFVLLTGGNVDLQQFLIGRIFDWPVFAAGESVGLRAAFWADFTLSALVIVSGAVLLAKLLGNSLRSTIAALSITFAGFALFFLAIDIDFGLEPVDTRQWGGFLVTLVVAFTGIVVSLPLGILLALGRRSTMPVVRLLSIIFIEFWRGVPVVTVLFFATYMLPLFLPRGMTVDTFARALIGVALFSAAYMAEVVRGGLQSIPRGQYEAAHAMGFGYWRTMSLVILPQALALVVPGIVNNFIGLFKDTTLVLIVAIFDLLGQLRAAFADPNWATPTTLYTGFAFAGMVYFVCCYAMSRYALFVERRLNIAGRR